MPDEGKGKVMRREVSAVERHYTWTGGRFPTRPNLKELNKLKGITATATSDTLKLKLDVSQSFVWGRSNEMAAQAVARAVGGADVDPVEK